MAVLTGALLLVMGPAGQARASAPFNPTFDIIQLSSQDPGVPADISYRIAVPAGDHLPGRVTLAVPPDWDVGTGAGVGDIVGNVSVSVDQSPCDDDIDGDGWTNTAEEYIGTDTRNACAPAGWPPDAAPAPDGNGVVQIDDITFVAGKFGLATGEEGYTPRAELASQNGTIQIDDVTAAAGRFGDAC